MSKHDEVMGDKITINNSAIGAVGSGAVNYGNVTSSPENYDYNLMREEIITLKNAIQSQPQSDAQILALSTIIQAEEGASTQNGTIMISALRKLSPWVFNVARDIGVNVIANFIGK
ncbi:hypothetical protein [Chitinophaga sp. S165]|uniref:hypothetical protein n=1 Tax=Chitinophaga sp. S165 TaxID=2135462 RepID=UPI000D70A200|nr:hypothetical protein [Chitinophaga sp. S165]PWV50383.1 hypothetical protein C7475_1043 [Chitinophaga sp. S165]